MAEPRMTWGARARAIWGLRCPLCGRGRVFAASEGVLNICYLAGVALAGVLGDLVGFRWSLMVAGAGFVLAGVLSQRLMTAPTRRGADEPGGVILEQGYLQGVPLALPPSGVPAEDEIDPEEEVLT